MSGRKRTPTGPDRALIAQSLTALARLDAATRPVTGLAKRAGISRVTLNKVLAGAYVTDVKLMALDDAVQVPPGTLKLIGEGAAFADLGLSAPQLVALERADHSKGPARNRRVM